MPIIATDGSSLGTWNGADWKAEGVGGWAAVILFEEDHPIAPGFTMELVGGKRRTTTGEVEVLGFLNALAAVKAYRMALEIDPLRALITPDCRFTLVADSKYVLQTYSEHLSNWIEAGWRKSTRGAIAHLALWQQIAMLRDEIGHIVTVQHQKGHTRKATDVDVTETVAANDRADRAAGIVARHIRDTGFLPEPAPIVWRDHAGALPDRANDIAKLRILTERVLREHGRAAAVEAFRLATHSTGIKE